MTVEIRPATRADVEAFRGEAGLGPTIQAVAGFVDGELVAIAGLAFAMGRVVAFADLRPEAKQHPVAVHRTAVRLLNDARAAGHKRIYAEADGREPTARRWLTRLGFKPMDDNEAIWEWRV